MITRRLFSLGLSSLIVAPAIVRATSLMPVVPMLSLREVNNMAKVWLDEARENFAKGLAEPILPNYRELARHWGDAEATLWRTRGRTLLRDTSIIRIDSARALQEVVLVHRDSMGFEVDLSEWRKEEIIRAGDDDILPYLDCRAAQARARAGGAK